MDTGPHIGVSSSDRELIRIGGEIERLSAIIAAQEARSEGTTQIEFAYLHERVATIATSSLAGAAVKLRGLLMGKGRGGRLSETDLASIRNVLDVVQREAEREAAARAGGPSAESGIELTVEGLVAQLTAVAGRYRALVARNLEIRANPDSSVAKSQALRTSLNDLETALAEEVAAHPVSEPKFLALFSYWEECRAARAMPRRADIDPLDLTDLWPDLGLWSLENGTDFRCRMCGTQVSALITDDPSGRLLSAVKHPFWSQERAVLDSVAKSKRPALSTRLVAGEYLTFNHRSLTLPLSNDGQTVDMLITATIFRNQQGDIEKPYFTRPRDVGQGDR